jgi:hypothetical protein
VSTGNYKRINRISNKPLNRLIFDYRIDFSGYVFPKVPETINFSFSEAIFSSSAMFDNCIFEDKMNFYNVIFEEPVGFSDAIFEKEVSFENAIFKKFAGFTRTKFNNILNLNNTHFEEYSYLKDMTFNQEILYSNLKIESYVSASDFYNCLEYHYDRMNQKELADKVFYKKMKYLRINKKYLKSNFIIKIFQYIICFLEWMFIDIVSDYGTNARKPILIWMILVIGIFPFLYFISNGISENNFFDYIYFSITTATTLGFGDVTPKGFGKTLASLESIFGMFIWTLLLAVISRKYMRK